MKTIGMPDEVAQGLYRILGIALDENQDIEYTNGIVKDLHIRCPHCNRKVQPIRENTTASNFPMKCRRCGKFFELNI